MIGWQTFWTIATSSPSNTRLNEPMLAGEGSHPQARRSAPHHEDRGIEPRRVFDAIEGELESRIAPQRLQA